jgi:hypothetical protein
VKIWGVIGAALVSVVVAGCGGGSSTQSVSTTTTAVRSASAKSADASASCHALTSSDFAKIGAIAPSKVEQLADSVGQRRTCSDLFIDASGGLILELTKVPGGPRELVATRQSARGSGVGLRPQPLPGVRGGFIVGHQVGFPDRGQVVTLSAGYTTSGQPELTPSQLVRLAVVVARR